jgi:hypothetical protein
MFDVWRQIKWGNFIIFDFRPCVLVHNFLLGVATGLGEEVWG